MTAGVEVRDRYDEADERYHVIATVENALAGHILSYRGSFTQDTDVDVTEDLRPLARLPKLPPR
jgi:hypothetical protein